MDFRLKDYITAPIRLIQIGKWMKKAPRIEPDEMEKILVEQLGELCLYAEKHVPFYKKWFAAADFDPRLMTDLKYYEKLPLLDKNTVRKNLNEMLSDEAVKLSAVECKTSGSTGTPLRFYLDKNVNSASFLLFYRAWKMCKNWNIFRAQATISGYADGKWKYSRITKILYLSSFQLDDDTVKEFYDLIIKYKVKFLRGYPSSLYRFAQLLERHNLKLEFKVMFSGAETLLPYQRKYIESVFNGKVIDHYTHWERTASICECMSGNLHAQNDYGYHEIVDDKGHSLAEGIGRLVCTGLYNKAMPLIRYDTRDLAEWSQTQNCGCGSNFPIVKNIIGRIEDVIVTPEGRMIGRLASSIKNNKNIKLAYIYQPTVEKMIVNICPFKEFNLDDEKALLEAELRKRVGNLIGIEFKIIGESEVPYTPAGKVRFVISEVDKNNQTTKLYQET